MAYKKKEEKHPNTVARQTPSNFECEAALLGCMMIDAQVADKLLSLLSEKDFYSPAHRAIYGAINKLHESGKAADYFTVIQQLELNGKTEAAGGAQYVSKLTSAMPSVANVMYYFDIVKNMTRLRELLKVANEIQDDAYSYDQGSEAISRAERRLFELSEDKAHDRLQKIDGPIKEALDDIHRRQTDKDYFKGIGTGFSSLDYLLNGGFQKGDLILVAARPGEGKTSIAVNFMKTAALSSGRKGKKYVCAIFSLEMSAMQIARRLVCSDADIPMQNVNSGRGDKNEWQKLMKSASRLSASNIYIDDTSMTTPAQILSKCRKLKHVGDGLDLVMIDYLQLMTSGTRTENRQLEIAEITRMLKIAAKELDIPIILLSQMSRSIDKRAGTTDAPVRPQLSDLRDSGAIEQDADIIMFLQRRGNPDQDGLVPYTLILAKNRNGSPGDVMLKFRRRNVTFLQDISSDRLPTPPPRERGAEQIQAVAEEGAVNPLFSIGNLSASDPNTDEVFGSEGNPDTAPVTSDDYEDEDDDGDDEGAITTTLDINDTL